MSAALVFSWSHLIFRAFPGPGLITENRYPVMRCCKARSHALRDQYLAGCCKASLETFCLLKDRNYRIHVVLGNGLCWGSLLARNASVPNELAADTTSSSFSRFLTLEKFLHACQKTLQEPSKAELALDLQNPKGGQMEVKKGQNSSERTQQSLPEGACSTGTCSVSISVVIWAADRGKPPAKEWNLVWHLNMIF